MGAGVALNLTLRYPQRVKGLLLVRPAWLAQPYPPNLDCMVEVGQWIRDYGVVRGRAGFLASPLYLRLQQEAPYTASSLLAQFDEPRAADAWPRLLRLPGRCPQPRPGRLALGCCPDADPCQPHRPDPPLRLCGDASPLPFPMPTWSKSPPRRWTSRPYRRGPNAHRSTSCNRSWASALSAVSYTSSSSARLYD